MGRMGLLVVLLAITAVLVGASYEGESKGSVLAPFKSPKQSGDPFNHESTMQKLAKSFSTFPLVPARKSLALNGNDKKAIETSGLYLWSTDRDDLGNMNEMGFDGNNTENEMLSEKEFEVNNPVMSFLDVSESPNGDFKKSQRVRRIPGPVNLPPPVRFPGDKDEAMVCHTPNELRRYLNYVGVDHDLESGVHLMSSPYYIKDKYEVTTPKNIHAAEWRVVDGTKESNDFTSKPKLDGLHYFWLHGNVNNHGHGRRCFDPELKYMETIDEIGPSSQEVRWGCLPFRVAGMALQSSVACAQKATGVQEWRRIEEKLLHDLSLEAMRQPPPRFKEAIHYAILRNLNISKAMHDEVHEAVRAEFGADPMAQVAATSKEVSEARQQLRNQTRERLHVLANCFLNVQRPLMCTPALSGASGMLGHGLTDFSSDWVQNSDRVVKSCHVPPGCSRLAAAQLLHFNLKQYQNIMPDLAVRKHPLWKYQCRFGSERNGPYYDHVSQGNCRLFSACFERSLRHLCSVVPECCPDTATHMECIKDIDGDRCGAVCQDFMPNDEFKNN